MRLGDREVKYAPGGALKKKSTFPLAVQPNQRGTVTLSRMARYFLITTVIGMFLLVSLLLAALFHLPAGEV